MIKIYVMMTTEFQPMTSKYIVYLDVDSFEKLRTSRSIFRSDVHVSGVDTSQICFNALHETMAPSRGWQWDRNAFIVLISLISLILFVLMNFLNNKGPGVNHPYLQPYRGWISEGCGSTLLSQRHIEGATGSRHTTHVWPQITTTVQLYSHEF